MGNSSKINVLQFVNWCESLVDNSSDSRIIVGICGPPAGGKSTLATYTAEAINRNHPGTVALLPQDAFHYPTSVLTAKGLVDVKGMPNTFDAELYLDKLKEVKRNVRTSVAAPTFNRANLDPFESAVRVDPGVRLIITEGIHLFANITPWTDICRLCDETIYIERDWKPCRKALMQRQLRKKAMADANKHVDLVDRTNFNQIELSKHRAHKIVRFTDWIDDS